MELSFLLDCLTTQLPLMEGGSSLSEGLARFANGLWNIFQVILGLGFVIFVHELGHFLAAKTFGVKCEKFYVGFDVPIRIGPIHFPRTLGKFRWGETEYGIGIIPLGGYVKMLGQDDDPRNAKAEAERIRTKEGDTNTTPDQTPHLDARSFPAKPVYARMIIISAGVIMNLIFGVLMAAVAYSAGVRYKPAVIGSVFAGDPAWQAGLRPGDQLLAVGEGAERNEKFRFEDMAGDIVSEGLKDPNKPVPIVVRRGDQDLEFAIQGSARLSPRKDFLQFSIGPATIARVGSNQAFGSFSPLKEMKIDLKAGDRIVAIDGTKLPVDPRFNETLSYEMTRVFQSKWEQPVEITVERPVDSKSSDANEAKTTHQVTLPAVPMRGLNIGFKVGPVVSVAAGSIAEKAGVKIGDSLISYAGNPANDAWKLPFQAAKLAQTQDVEFLFNRMGADKDPPTEIRATVSAGATPEFDVCVDSAGRLTIKSLGIAFEPLPIVSTVDPNSSAAKAGMQPGDELRELRLDPTPELEKELEAAKVDISKPFSVDSKFNVAGLCRSLQELPVNLPMKLLVIRDGKTVEISLQSEEVPGQFWHQRGIPMMELTSIHTSSSLSESLTMGVVELRRGLYKVIDFLKMAFTGRIPPTLMGGPLTIAQVASIQAEEGFPKLLTFLTLLSANLAVINFLPIPALDGGHMVFLTAEAILGKPVNENWQGILQMVGVLLLLALMAFVMVNDVLRISGNPF